MARKAVQEVAEHLFKVELLFLANNVGHAIKMKFVVAIKCRSHIPGCINGSAIAFFAKKTISLISVFSSD